MSDKPFLDLLPVFTMAGIDVHVNSSLAEDAFILTQPGAPHRLSPLIMSPTAYAHLKVEIEGKTYRDKCNGHERVRYEARRAKVRAHGLRAMFTVRDWETAFR